MRTLSTDLPLTLALPKWSLGSYVRALAFSFTFIGTSACLAQPPAPPDSGAQVKLKEALTLPPQQRRAAFKALLSSLEYYVTQEQGTERPFQNRYWDNKAAGLYVDVISGVPLFSSQHKYRSGTGWPSFDRALSPELVREVRDTAHGMVRVEVVSASSGAHLGHVFEDGPPSTGRRYCMNSAALRFVPLSELKAQGYEPWIKRAGLNAQASRTSASPSAQ